MSERESNTDETVLETNIERLLAQMQVRPEVPETARARMLARLHSHRDRPAVALRADSKPKPAAATHQSFSDLESSPDDPGSSDPAPDPIMTHRSFADPGSSPDDPGSSEPADPGSSTGPTDPGPAQIGQPSPRAVPPTSRPASGRFGGRSKADPAAASSEHRPPRKRRWAPLALTSLAAVLILAFVFGVGDKLKQGLSGDSGERLALHEHTELGARELTLADGTRALLRSGTTLEELSPGHLRLIAGEIVLEVAERAEPLIVETPQGRALVTGTRLLLRAEGDETLAAVLRGRATLQQGQATELLLRAGERAVIDAEGEIERRLGRRLSYELDWARELLAPAERPTPIRRGNLLARVPRWTGQIQASAEWPLAIRRMVVDVHIEDGHIRTTIDQTFFNHVERNLEGIYQFPLPADAAVSRLAMYVDGKRMEAGVVERDRGRDIYEQIVHRRRDPALLEWVQGNLFQIRVFPLPARTEKRIVLSYTQSLDSLYGDANLRVPIPEIDLPVGEIEYRIRVVGGAGQLLESRNHPFELSEDGDDLTARFVDRDHRIGADIVARLSAGHDAEDPDRFVARITYSHALHPDGSRHLAVRVRPDLSALAPDATDAPARDVVVLFDSSASRDAAGLEAQRRFLVALREHLDDDDRLAVQVFDSRVRWFSPDLLPVSALDHEALDRFVARQSRTGLGATDLGTAIDAGLESLASAPPLPGDGRPRVPLLLYLGDGLNSDLGALGSNPLSASARLQAKLSGDARFAAVSFGDRHDDALLEALVSAGAGLHLHVAADDSIPWRAFELLSTLSTPRVLELEALLLDTQGQPVGRANAHLDIHAIADGERVTLLTKLDPDSPEPATIELRGRAAHTLASQPSDWSQRYDLPSVPERDSLWLPRAWARAQVAAWIADDPEAHAAEITVLGLAHFLVTPTTSLLVLESEKMYRDFDVHRPSKDAWARYETPDRIEVVRDSNPAGHADRGQYVVRTPIPTLVQHNYNANAFSQQFRITTRTTAGSLGLGGAGRGGGGGGFGPGFGIGLNTAWKERPPTEAQNIAGASTVFGGFTTRQSGPGPTWRRPSSGATTAWNDPRRGTSHLDNFRAGGKRAEFNSGFGSLAEDAAGEFITPASRPWPQALHYADDMRLDDLGELAPALFEDGFDLERERLLLTGLDGARGSVSPAARTLIEAARAAQANASFSLPDGANLHIDADGGFSVETRRWGFLDERVVYDGAQLRADYPALGLSVVREVGETSPALLGQWVPWMIPPADHLAVFYTVERSAPLALTLTPFADESDSHDSHDSRDSHSLVVEFDADSRVVALRVIEADIERSRVEFQWSEAGVVIVREGDEREVERLVSKPVSSFTPGAQATLVSLPLPSPLDLEDALAQTEPGSTAWTAMQHQRLAALVALARTGELPPVLTALHDQRGSLLPGELALAGAGLRHADPKLRAKLLGGDSKAEPVVAYLRAAFLSHRRRPAALRAIVENDALFGTPVHFMASYRALLHAAEGRHKASSLSALQSFLGRYQHPEFSYIATTQLTSRWWSYSSAVSQRKAEAWLALADQGPTWRQFALHEAGAAYQQYGKYAAATEIFRRAFKTAREAEVMPVVDWTVQYALTQSQGEAGWQLAWARLRRRVAKSEDPRLAVAFLQTAQQLGRLEDARRAIEGLEPETMSLGLTLQVFDTLVAYDLTSEAAPFLEAALERSPDDPAVLGRASVFAQQQGDLPEAARLLEQGIQIQLDTEELSLDDLRLDFTALFDLRARLARPLGATDETKESARQRALAVADRWRHEDPDNPQIDQLCAELMWALGDDDEAWRQLSSHLDRHPANGAALAYVADILERNGELERASALWARAVAVEPTDATLRMRRAQSLLASDREEEARGVLDELIEGDWQPRFEWTVREAKRLRSALD